MASVSQTKEIAPRLNIDDLDLPESTPETALNEPERGWVVLQKHREDSPEHYYWFDWCFSKMLLQEAVTTIND